MRLRHPRAWIAGGILIIAVILAIFVLRLFDESSAHSKDHPPYPEEYGAQTFEDQGREHIPAGAVFNAYNSRPPTSGPHGPALPWGIYDGEVPKESAVHNLEHGGVVIWYNCQGGPEPLDAAGCDQLREDLAGVAGPRIDDGMFVVMTPYADMDSRIALTAWQTLDAFDDFDAERIEAFIKSFECKFDPERACR